MNTLTKTIRVIREEGVNGLLTHIRRRASRRLEQRSTATSVDHKEALAWFERRRDSYEPLINAVARYVNADAVIFDVGANVGYFTLQLAEKIDFHGNTARSQFRLLDTKID